MASEPNSPALTEENRGGRFQPGQSGNPAGRPKGSGISGEARALIAQGVPGIIAKMQEQALSGDVAAARLLMERTIPPMRPGEEPVCVDLGSGTLTEKGEAVMRAVSEGELSPSQGAALMSDLGALVSLAEADDIKRRLAELEARAAGIWSFTKHRGRNGISIHASPARRVGEEIER